MISYIWFHDISTQLKQGYDESKHFILRAGNSQNTNSSALIRFDVFRHRRVASLAPLRFAHSVSLSTV